MLVSDGGLHGYGLQEGNSSGRGLWNWVDSRMSMQLQGGNLSNR